ncbi:MAG: hypothetical protein ABSH51_23240 [Solirubrobacteraceae bacterium]
MSLYGHIYRITEPGAFFESIAAAGGASGRGYEPWPGVEVSLLPLAEARPARLSAGQITVKTDQQGAFRVPDLQSAARRAVPDRRAVLEACLPSCRSRWLYRSAVDVAVDGDDRGDLAVWLLAARAEVTAGEVSGALARVGLELDTTITATASGLAVTSADGTAGLRFGVSQVGDAAGEIAPTVTLALTAPGLPASGAPARAARPAAPHALSSGLQAAASALTDTVVATLTDQFARRAGLHPRNARAWATAHATLTIVEVAVRTRHCWPLVRYTGPYPSDFNTTDPTPVITVDAIIAYPRHLTAERPHRADTAAAGDHSPTSGELHRVSVRPSAGPA